MLRELEVREARPHPQSGHHASDRHLMQSGLAQCGVHQAMQLAHLQRPLARIGCVSDNCLAHLDALSSAIRHQGDPDAGVRGIATKRLTTYRAPSGPGRVPPELSSPSVPAPTRGRRQPEMCPSSSDPDIAAM